MLKKQGQSQDRHAKVIIRMTVIFTLCYALRTVNSLVIAMFKTEDNYILNNFFGRKMYRYTTVMVWDLPAILSTIYLNYGLVKQLEQETHFKSRHHIFKYRSEELAINSVTHSVFNDSELEGSQVSNSPRT
jgi:hypothetical protein